MTGDWSRDGQHYKHYKHCNVYGLLGGNRRPRGGVLQNKPTGTVAFLRAMGKQLMLGTSKEQHKEQQRPSNWASELVLICLSVRMLGYVIQ